MREVALSTEQSDRIAGSKEIIYGAFETALAKWLAWRVAPACWRKSVRGE
jgi:hypothetical protein